MDADGGQQSRVGDVSEDQDEDEERRSERARKVEICCTPSPLVPTPSTRYSDKPPRQPTCALLRKYDVANPL